MSSNKADRITFSFSFSNLEIIYKTDLYKNLDRYENDRLGLSDGLKLITPIVLIRGKLQSSNLIAISRDKQLAEIIFYLVYIVVMIACEELRAVEPLKLKTFNANDGISKH